MELYIVSTTEGNRHIYVSETSLRYVLSDSVQASARYLSPRYINDPPIIYCL